MIAILIGGHVVINEIISNWHKGAVNWVCAKRPATRRPMLRLEVWKRPLNVLSKSLSMAGLSQVMREHHFAGAVLIDVDGMDGSWHPSFSTEQVWAVAGF